MPAARCLDAGLAQELSILVGGEAGIPFSVRSLSTSHGAQSHKDQNVAPVLSVSRKRVGGWEGWRAAPEIKSLQHPGQRKIRGLARFLENLGISVQEVRGRSTVALGFRNWRGRRGFSGLSVPGSRAREEVGSACWPERGWLKAAVARENGSGWSRT